MIGLDLDAVLASEALFWALVVLGVIVVSVVMTYLERRDE